MTENPQTEMSNGITGAVMVVGGGISGMQSALDLANSGFKVYLVESSPAIGGKMAQLDKTFPTNDCSMCIVSPKLVEVGRHRNIELLTHSEVASLEGEAGNFSARITQQARYVDVDKCTGCGLCELVCPVTQISWFPEQPEEGDKKKKLKAKNKRIISGPGAPQPTSLVKWKFSVDEEKCSKCGGCYRACLHGAVSWQKKEIEESKKSLEKMFGVTVTYFSYPYGQYNDSIVQMCFDAGYEAMFTVDAKKCTAGSPNGELGRYDVQGSNLWIFDRARHRVYRLHIDAHRELSTVPVVNRSPCRIEFHRVLLLNLGSLLKTRTRKNLQVH